MAPLAVRFLLVSNGMNNKDDNRDSMAPESGENVDANTRDQNQHKPEQQRADQERGSERVPTSKGTDTPATTGAEYAERERGKRTTM